MEVVKQSIFLENIINIYVCMCLCIYVCAYIYIHTCTYNFLSLIYIKEQQQQTSLASC